MKQSINITLIIFIILFASCNSAKVVYINKSQTAQGDSKKNVTHIMSSHQVKIKSKEAKKLNDLGIKHGKLGDYELARVYLKKALKIEGENAAIYGNLGLVEMLSNNFDAATEYFLQSIKINSSYVNSYVNLGVNYDRNEKYNKALEIYSKILTLDSDDDFLIGSVHLNMANSYFNLNRCKDAKSSIDIGKKIIGEKVYEILPGLVKDEKDIMECLKNK